MAVVIMDGKTRVSWLVAVANTAAPTVAEMAGGVSLETAFTPDGLDIKVTTGRKDTSNLASRRNSERVTRISYAVAGTFYRDDTNDIAWNLLPYGAKGFLVVREGIDRETPWASGQRVRVFRWRPASRTRSSRPRRSAGRSTPSSRSGPVSWSTSGR